MLEEGRKALTPMYSGVYAPLKLSTCLLSGSKIHFWNKLLEPVVPRFVSVSTTPCCSFLHTCCMGMLGKKNIPHGPDETKTNKMDFCMQ